MTYREYSEEKQAGLAELLRAGSHEHRYTPLYLWRTALEQVNPEILLQPPHGVRAGLIDVYDLLSVANGD